MNEPTLDALRDAARGGDTCAMLEFADACANGGCGIDAARWYEAAADAGEITSPKQLGDLYRIGCGDLVADAAQAHDWYARAVAIHEGLVEQGGEYAPWAMLSLGELLLHGYGVDRDEVRALALLERSFAEGVVHAGHALARHYLRDPANRDDVARGLAVLEAAGADVYAMSQLTWWFGPYGGGPDPARERHWIERLAASGDAQAQRRLREIEAEQERIAQRSAAIAQMEVALAEGRPGARRMLAMLLTHAGEHARAIELAEDAHAAGEDWAWFNLVMRYQLGSGVPVDKARARHWKRAGAGRGDPGAMLQLAEDLFESREDPLVAAAWVVLAESQRYGKAFDLPNDESREALARYTKRFSAKRLAAVEALVARHDASGGTWWPGDPQ